MALDPKTGEGVQNDPNAEGQVQGDKGGQVNQEMVPVSVVQSMRDELKDVKGQLQSAQDQIRLYQVNAPQAGGQAASTEQKKGASTEALSGMEDDDVITVADAKKLVTDIEARVGSVLSEVVMATQNKDYNEVINKHLPKVLQANPALVSVIKNSSNRALVAYELGKTDPEYLKTKAEKDQEGTVKKIEENLQKPGSSSAAGGGGGGLSQIDMYAQMSDDELEKRIQTVKNRG